MSFRNLIIALLVATCLVTLFKLSPQRHGQTEPVALPRVAATAPARSIRPDMIRSDIDLSPSTCADLPAPTPETIRTLPGARGLPQEISASGLSEYLEQTMASEEVRVQLACRLYRQLRAQ